MFLTIKEFWLKWRLRVAEEQIKANTRMRKSLVRRHAEQVSKYERIKVKLEGVQ